MDSVGFTSHDHNRCISGGLQTVEDFCKTNRLQLTPVRRRVLEILLQQHRALGAYEILDFLRDEGDDTMTSTIGEPLEYAGPRLF